MNLRPALLFLAGAPLFAAPITDIGIVNLSNYQSTPVVSIISGYSGYGGFVFGSPSIQGDTVYLPLGGGGYLRSNPTAQSISAQASVDFSVPGYRITAMQLYGLAEDDGTSAGEAFGISGPCALSVFGTASYGIRNCTLPQGGLGEGTITAWLRMYSDARVRGGDGGRISGPMLTMTLIHNPEPDPMILLGLGLIAVWAMGRKFRKT